jgi:hypothetical protein
MAETEQANNKVLIATKVEPEIFNIIDRFRNEEDRNMSNMIERLLKTHPRVQEVLETEEVAVGQ